MKKTYPLFDIYWDENDVEKVTRVIKRGSYWATGPEIREFEEKLENFFNVTHVVVFNSGTSALHSALLASGTTSGEVIVPSMSFISTANCVVLAGAKPVFADIERETIGLDLESVKEKISNKTKAIIPMHYGGKVCKNIIALREIADDHDLLLIEDNAESFGAKFEDKLAGTIGHASMLSFCQNKIITTGEGGAICTNDNELYKKLLLVRSHGRVESKIDYFSNIYELEYVDIGYNYRIPTMCAALGISQLDKIEKIIMLRRKIGKFYDVNLRDIPQIELLEELKGHTTVYQLYNIMVKNSEKRTDLQEFLLKNGITTKVYFYPIHLKQFYREKYGYHKGMLTNTEQVSKKLLALPVSLRFTENDQRYIINKIKEFFK